MSKIRFGIIGHGAWGRCHAEAIKGCSEAELTAITNGPDGVSAETQLHYPETNILDDYHELVEREDVDVVSVVSPNDLHFEHSLAALKQGKHVLLEKPMTIRLDHADTLIREARRQGQMFMIGHQFRLSSLWGRLKALLEAGAVGRPQYVLVELARNPYRQGSDGWRFQIDRVGDWLLEEPVHFFDLARWYLGSEGEPTTIYAAANSRHPDHPELQDNLSAILHFDSNAYAVVTSTLSAFEHHHTVKVTGTEGAAWASWSGSMDRTRHPDYSLKTFDGKEVAEHAIHIIPGELYELESQIQRVVDVLNHQAAIHCNATDGRWAIAMCHAAQESIIAGKPVTF